MLGRLFNPQKLAHTLVETRVRRGVVDLCEGLGAQRLKWLIQQNKSLWSLLTSDQQRQVMDVAPSWKWAAATLNDDDLRSMIPPWALELVTEQGEAGERWLSDLLISIRRLFAGGQQE